MKPTHRERFDAPNKRVTLWLVLCKSMVGLKVGQSKANNLTIFLCTPPSPSSYHLPDLIPFFYLSFTG